ncbi:hypothetical protein Dimus_006034 [Dionaea muscipula]
MATQQSETIKERRDANQSLKERLEDEKNKRKALVGVLNEYDGRLKVNSIQEFIHSTKFEDSLAKTCGMLLWPAGIVDHEEGNLYSGMVAADDLYR